MAVFLDAKWNSEFEQYSILTAKPRAQLRTDIGVSVTNYIYTARLFAVKMGSICSTEVLVGFFFVDLERFFLLSSKYLERYDILASTSSNGLGLTVLSYINFLFLLWL